jgi:hypothetical protein
VAAEFFSSVLREVGMAFLRGYPSFHDGSLCWVEYLCWVKYLEVRAKVNPALCPRRPFSLAGRADATRALQFANGFRTAAFVFRLMVLFSILSRVQSLSSVASYAAWLGVIACIFQSGLFAGLNLAVFSLSLLRLQIEADGGNPDAVKVLELRKNANQVLATAIWGNVTTNVLLTLLSDSLLTGLGAFFFSAFAITLLGEIIPQAYFSRNALRMTSRFLPFLVFYRTILFPLARPTALLLDG